MQVCLMPMCNLKPLFFSPFLLAFQISFSQTYSSAISDSQILKFLNWQIRTEGKYPEEPKNKRKVIYFRIISWDTADFKWNVKNKLHSIEYDLIYLFNDRNKWLDTLFTKEDREYFFQQFTNQRDTVWRQSFNHSKLSHIKKQRKPNRHSLSLPLFSLDNRYVIIRENYHCGSLCGYGAVKVYRRIDADNWEYIRSVNGWIS
jgi:hypothetical protein